ncbi:MULTISPECIES: TFIIB-type zinc ribbon-containing protein [Terrabacteria group]|uniref:TFIIB-type zinc ribbon-containing protein n=1 Tax=Bacillati TaxID=1783272 RepID=UPI001C6E6448|nr:MULTISPECIES: TFIIB-type zinc ribbon-containing protein [Terrabacteria group]MBW9212757.1 TFIIB-type zinc ribbon-containing protein [Trueperella sp. zg.1013]
MSQSSTNIQCFNCGSPLRFDANQQKLVCDHCGSIYSPEEVDTRLEKRESKPELKGSFAQKSNHLDHWSEVEENQMASYSCQSCGAQIIADKTMAASSCPYCANPMVIESQINGGLKPDQIIPFKQVKQTAINTLKHFYKNKPLLPNNFKEENHIKEIKGIYVPFWLYDGRVEGYSQCKATVTTSDYIGDDIYQHTHHYLATRAGDVEFERVPADASTKMPDELMDAIEPFRYDDLTDFQMSYLAGYFADRYDVNSDEDSNRVDQRIQNTTIHLFNQEFSAYDTSYPIHEKYEIHPGSIHYVFLPVWLLTTRYKGKNYRFAMNGQTGKMVSDDLPVDKKKALRYFTLTALIIFAILYVSLFILWR